MTVDVIIVTIAAADSTGSGFSSCYPAAAAITVIAGAFLTMDVTTMDVAAATGSGSSS